MLTWTALVVILSTGAAAEAEVTPMPGQVRKQIAERMIGPWTYEVTWGETTMTGEETTRWAGRRSAIVIEGHLTVGNDTNHYVIVLGWDGPGRALVSHGFNSDGDTWTGRWTDLSQDKWGGHASGTYQGIKWNSPVSLEFMEDSLRYKDVTDGKPWVAVYKRKPK